MRKPTPTAAFPGQFGISDWCESGIVRILEDLFNLCCRKPIQTKHSGLCRECETGLYVRLSLEGQGKEWMGATDNWRNEIVYQTGHRKNLKNAKISNLSNESQNSKKQATRVLRATQLEEPLPALLDSSVVWLGPPSQSVNTGCRPLKGTPQR